MSQLKVGVIGASGYGGAELVRLLLNHPDVTLTAISSRQYTGQPISDLYPGLRCLCDLKFDDQDQVVEQSDCVFAALPSGYSEEIAKKCVAQGKKFIDLGADFRLDSSEVYQAWYGKEFTDSSLHEKSVYGQCEIHHDLIENANIIGNPGCYPTSIELGCYPALKKGIVETSHIILDSKSGATGAGKSLSENTHFPRTNEAFAPYKVGCHRHTPEIEQMLSEIAQEPIQVTFVPHLLPINRGIISTIYLPLKEDLSLEEIHELYKQTYADKQFVRVLDLGQIADLKFVKYSNYCDISLHMDAHTHTLIVVSCIDNMVKGAAGQAIQNMNIMYHFEEDSGLKSIAPSF